MLDFIRTHRNLFSILFVVSGFALIISMFADPYSGQGASALSQAVAARVDGAEISLNELAGEVNRQRSRMQENMETQIAGSENKAETRKFMDQLLKSQVSPDRVLGEMLNERFMIRSAEAAGIDVPPQAIVDILHQEPFFQKDGKFDALRYKQVVTQPGRYEAELRSRAKQYALNRAVLNSLSFISPSEESTERALRKRYHFETLSLNSKTLGDVPKAGAEEIKQFANDPAQSAKLQSFYDRNITRYKKGEELHARHILIKEEGGGEKKAVEILSEIQNKKLTFEEAAAKFSADPSNAQKGGDLGFFPRGMMDPAFEKAAFGLAKDQDLLAKPVKSSFGFHLIQRVGYKAAEQKALSDVKEEIASEVILENKRGEKARDLAKNIANGSAKLGAAELKKMNLNWTPVTWTPLDSTLGAVGSVDEHRSKLVSLSEASPYLGEVLNQGENFIVVKWAKAPKEDAAAKNDETALRLAQEKAYAAMQFALKNSREKLEKSKKIVKNDKAISELRQALGDTDSGMPLGR